MRWFTPSLVRHCIAHEEWWEEKEEAISRYVAVLYRRQVSLYLPLRAGNMAPHLLTFPRQTALFVDFLETGYMFLLL